MRFVALALGVLGLAGLKIGEAVNTDGSPSATYGVPVETLLTRSQPSMSMTTEPPLTRWHLTDSVPPSSLSRSFGLAPIHRRQQISLTLPFTGTCKEGYTTSKEIFQSSVCDTPKTQEWDTRPCALSWIAEYICMTTSTTYSMWSSNDLGGRSQRWVAKYAKATPATALPTITSVPHGDLHGGLPGKPGHPSAGHPFNGKLSGSPILEPLRTKPAEVMPTITTIPASHVPVHRREESSPTTSFTGCSWGYFPIASMHIEVLCSSYWSGGPVGTRTCTSVGEWSTTGCTQTMCSMSCYGPREPTATSDTITCQPTCPYSRTWRKVAKFAARTTQDLGSRSQRAVAQFAPRSTQNLGGRSQCAVAQFAPRSTQDLGGRSQHAVTQIAARSTQDLGGRSQRYVVRFAEPTITPKPTEAAAAAATGPFPTCSFDLSAGQYICPKAAKTLPICSFDLLKGEYICPSVAEATPMPAPCPGGAEKCIPAGEKPYHVTVHDSEIPPPDRCVECFLAIEDCRRDCDGDDQDCKNACTCEMYQQILACQRCKEYKKNCGGKAEGAERR